ncbi:MAG: replicative DNA helicase [Acidobacteria bacterium]|nr:replicative DNA helicase [Acidobacteriota bacterium]
MSVEATPPTGPARTELRLPWDEQAERAVLGALLLESAALDAALEILHAGDFHREAHRWIFEAVVNLSSRSDPIDPVTVISELERMLVLERAGGATYVASLIDALPRTTNVAAYARIVHDRSVLRQALRVAETLRDQAASGARPAAEVLDDAQRELFALSDVTRRGGFASVQEIGPEGLRAIEELSNRRELITGVATGYTKLDHMTSGLQRGDMVVLAARPSMGKTSLALNIAQHAAIHGRASVGVFSLEMSRQQLFFRLLCGEARIDLHKLRTGRLAPEDWERLTHAYDVLMDCKIFIDETAAIAPMELRAKARRLKAEHGLDLLVIDYLQLMRPDARGGDPQPRNQEITYISSSLKAIAKELQVPVLVLSQLSRAPEQRKDDHRPQLSDLRESGSIEQDADVVMFIYRAEMYEKDPAKVAEKDLEGRAEVIIAKQRNGPTGYVPLFFVKQFTRFENQADEREPF